MHDLITAHFRMGEFACRCCGELPPETEYRDHLVQLCQMVLEGIREDWGAPLVVVCGWRCPGHNADLFRRSEERAKLARRHHGGVAKNSQHLLGRAADVRPLDLGRMDEFFRFLQSRIERNRYPALGGWGAYPHWLHVDTGPRRSDDRPRFWGGIGQGDEATDA